MSAQFEPDQALQQWRDQIEENTRLQHAIADRDVQVEKLGRLNHDVLFEANRYKALYEAVTSERDYLQRKSMALQSRLEAVAGVAAGVARTIEDVADMALLAATSEPPVIPPTPADPVAPPTPAEPDPAPAPTAEEVPPDPLTDPALELPSFLTSKGDHATPLPQVVP